MFWLFNLRNLQDSSSLNSFHQSFWLFLLTCECTVDTENVKINTIAVYPSVNFFFWFSASPGLRNILPITTAKVPIVKFYHISTSLEGDISLYNTLVQLTPPFTLIHVCFMKTVDLWGLKLCAKLVLVPTCTLLPLLCINVNLGTSFPTSIPLSFAVRF